MKALCSIHGVYEKENKRSGCPKCKTITTKIYDKTYRDKEADKFYHSAKWKRVRKIQLKKHPLCCECGKPATVADHIIEIKDGGCKLCLDNLQSLCHACHNAKTAEEKIRRGREKSLHLNHQNTEAAVRNMKKQFSGGTLE